MMMTTTTTTPEICHHLVLLVNLTLVVVVGLGAVADRSATAAAVSGNSTGDTLMD